MSDGRTLDYEYDAEERITKVVDKIGDVVTTTEYAYDALGQLLTEKVNNVIVNTMTYDNYGNIVEKNGKTYTYGNAKWKDLLTSYDDQTITYDAQGNPLSYLGHTLEWEKGRQLKKFDSNTYIVRNTLTTLLIDRASLSCVSTNNRSIRSRILKSCVILNFKLSK